MPQYPMQSSETYSPDRLVAGLTQLVTENRILVAGQSLKRGTVVGRITASGKYTLSTAAASDGSEVPYAILADDYDATLGDIGPCAAYTKGEFNERAIILGTGHSLTSVRGALRAGGIYLKPAVPLA